MNTLASVLSCASLFAAAAFAAPIYVITDLGTLGGSQSTAYRVNEQGISAGWSRTPQGISQAVIFTESGVTTLPANGGAAASGINNSGTVVGNVYNGGNSTAGSWSGGAFNNLGTLGGSDSWATGINDAAQIVGSATTNSGEGRAFLYQNGSMTNLGTLPGTVASAATGINNSGQVIGSAQSAYGRFSAFVWTPEGGMQQIGGPGTYVFDINDAGQIAGHRLTGGYFQAFLYSGGSFQNLGTLGGFSSFAYGINDLGHVVGYSWTADGTNRAFLYADGVMLDLTSLLPQDSGWELLEAYGINGAGQIVGTGLLKGQVHAFRLDPQASSHSVSETPIENPEPSTWILIAAGGALIFVRHFRKAVVR